MSNVLQFPTIVRKPRDHNWFLEYCFYGSEYENALMEELVTKEWADMRDGGYIDINAHLATVHAWLECLIVEGVIFSDEERQSIIQECQETLKYWVQRIKEA